MDANIARQIAHDIKSPLSVISLLSKKLTALDPEARALLRAAQARLDLLTNLLHEPQGQPSRGWELAADLASVLSEKSIEFEHADVIGNLNLWSGCDFLVNYPRALFGAMASNLINNSVEASDQKNCKVHVLLTLSHRGLELKVQDSGAGLSRAVLAQLGRRVVSTKSHGSGLGTYSMIHGVKKYGGRVEFDSEIKKGTTVSVWLPVARAIPRAELDRPTCLHKLCEHSRD